MTAVNSEKRFCKKLQNRVYGSFFVIPKKILKGRNGRDFVTYHRGKKKKERKDIVILLYVSN